MKLGNVDISLCVFIKIEINVGFVRNQEFRGTNKCWLFLRKYNNSEKLIDANKIRHSKRAYIYYGISPKRTTGARRQKLDSPTLRHFLDVFWWCWWSQMLTYDGVDRNFEPRVDHSNILKLGTPKQRWRTKDFVLSREPQQHFEIVDSKFLILARTCEKNEVACTGKSRGTTTN